MPSVFSLPAYFRDFRRSTRRSKGFVSLMLCCSLILFVTSIPSEETRRAERLVEKRLSRGGMPTSGLAANLWLPQAARWNALCCLLLAACWPLVERQLTGHRAGA